MSALDTVAATLGLLLVSWSLTISGNTLIYLLTYLLTYLFTRSLNASQTKTEMCDYIVTTTTTNTTT